MDANLSSQVVMAVFPAVNRCGIGIALQNAYQKENERISTMPFLLSNFSPGDKIENCSAQFLAVRWIVHFQFKVHRLRDGFSVSNALLLDQSVPSFIGYNLDKIGEVPEGSFSKKPFLWRKMIWR